LKQFRPVKALAEDCRALSRILLKLDLNQQEASAMHFFTVLFKMAFKDDGLIMEFQKFTGGKMMLSVASTISIWPKPC